VNSWPIRLLPTGFPATCTMDPLAFSLKPGSKAISQMANG
jgi:hypothetical protein